MTIVPSNLLQTGQAFGQKLPPSQPVRSSKASRRNDSSDLMELAGESFGKASQQVSSPQQFLRPDLTVGSGIGSHEDDTRGDFERDSAHAMTDDLRTQLNDLKLENAQLKQYLIEAQQAVNSDAQTTRIRELLREREPKLEEVLLEAMKHERANQEKKDKKVLEILQFKDS